jgi:hypothetical protein
MSQLLQRIEASRKLPPLPSPQEIAAARDRLVLGRMPCWKEMRSVLRAAQEATGRPNMRPDELLTWARSIRDRLPVQ